MLRSLLIKLSTNETAQKFVSHFGPVRRVALRFVAGETVDEAVAVVKRLNAQGIKATLNHVGESVTTQAEATQAAGEFQELLRRIAAEKLDSSISVKPSHLGLAFGPDFYYETIADIVQTARQYGLLVEIDIEGSADVEATLTVCERLWQTFGNGIRQALQAYLFRTPADIQRLVELGIPPNIRLVKGAYEESPDEAYQDRQEIIMAAIRLMELFLTPSAVEFGAYLALGSHDPVLIENLLRETTVRGIARDKFEIQMLLGVRRDEQQRLARLGYQVRVYVPYGPAWYPYFMRRLAERPANLLFILRALFGK
jgi:proline dehydrogenase